MGCFSLRMLCLYFFCKSLVEIFQVAEVQESGAGLVNKNAFVGGITLAFKTSWFSGREGSYFSADFYKNENSPILAA